MKKYEKYTKGKGYVREMERKNKKASAPHTQEPKLFLLFIIFQSYD